MSKKELSQAAEKVANAEKSAKKEKAKNPNGNIFVRAGKAIKKFCKDLKGEIKKIIWPDGKTVLKSTGVVLVAVTICCAAIFGIDQLLAFLLSLLEKGAQSVADSRAAADVTTTAATAAFMSFGGFIG